MGTAAYMSPEQARGEELDARTDLFSFGAVLYEMMTGRQAFRGASRTTISTAIQHDSPPRPSQVNPGLPSELDRIITKALEKDRNLRYQHASDIRTDLTRLQRDTNSDSQMIAGLVKRHKRATTGLVAAGVVIAAALIYALYRPTRLAPVSPAGLEFTRVTGSGDVQRADISPDGMYVAYVRETGGKRSVWLQQLVTGSDVQIATMAEDQCLGLAFSPDGSYLYFVRQHPGKSNGDLYEVPSLGGSPRKCPIRSWPVK